MQLLQQQQLMQNINTDPMSSILAQQMAQLQMQQQLTFQQPLTYPSVSLMVEPQLKNSTNHKMILKFLFSPPVYLYLVFIQTCH